MISEIFFKIFALAIIFIASPEIKLHLYFKLYSEHYYIIASFCNDFRFKSTFSQTGIRKQLLARFFQFRYSSCTNFVVFFNFLLYEPVENIKKKKMKTRRDKNKNEQRKRSHNKAYMKHISFVL